MKKIKLKEIEVELSIENYEGIKKIAEKSGLKWEQVASMILRCELDIIKYLEQRRSKLAKRLKIDPKKEFET